MEKSRNTFEPSVVCEPLEPRLLLSVASVEPSAFSDLTGAPAYISADLLPGVLAQGYDNVSSDLRHSQQAIASMLAENTATDLSQFSSQAVRVNQNGDLHVYVHVDQVNESTVQSLQAAGLSVQNSNEGMGVVQGWVNYASLDTLAAMQGVSRISAPAYAITNTGGINTAGDGILNADDLRSQMSVTGSGVKIGVISDGLDHWDDVDDTGDLPTYSSGITVHSTFSGKGDEGTAMLEIIYDLASGVDLYFAGFRSDGNFSTIDMISAIDWMVVQGVDIIVDDVGFLDQPMFEDGTDTIADAAADAVSSGVVYVTAAGNYANKHYQVDYDNIGNGTHEFATGQNILRFYLEPGSSVTGELQWSDQWGSSGNDYNLFLLEWTGSSWSYENGSTTVQDGDDNPREWIWVENQGESQSLLAWVIYKASGSDRELEFFIAGNSADFSIHASDTGIMTPGDSIFGHAAVESVISVGAISASDPGHDDVMVYSSRGPSTIYTNFSTQTSTTRNTLDVCGITDVYTKVGDLGYFSNPFTGTSAAAPHIAAIAGLLLEIDPTLTPAQIHDLLTDNAVDIEDAGYDQISGYGRADALATVTAAATAVDLLAATDTGVSTTDNITKLDNHDANSKLQFNVSGTIQDATVKLYGPGDVLIGQGTGNGGTLTITTNGSQDLADGVNGIYATQEVADKLESAATSSLSVTVDTVAPSTPSAPDLQADSDTGYLNNDEITNDTTPTFDVSASPYFRFYRGETKISGDYETEATFTPSSAQSEGTHNYSVSVLDAAGNESTKSTALSVTIDTTAPTVTNFQVQNLYNTWDSTEWTNTAGWAYLDTIIFIFSEDVVGYDHYLTVEDDDTNTYSYADWVSEPAVQTTLTWVLDATLASDNYTVTLSTSLADEAGNTITGTVEYNLYVAIADFNDDGVVDGTDFGLWQTGYPTGSGAERIDGDADGDGDVDGVDFGLWMANYPYDWGL